MEDLKLAAAEWLRLDRDEWTRSEILQLLKDKNYPELENRLAKSECYPLKCQYVPPSAIYSARD